jgi:hypothetical protein
MYRKNLVGIAISIVILQVFTAPSVLQAVSFNQNNTNLLEATTSNTKNVTTMLAPSADVNRTLDDNIALSSERKDDFRTGVVLGEYGRYEEAITY